MTAAVLAIAAVLAAAGAPPSAVREEARWLMGTLAVIRVEADDEPTAAAAVQSAWAALDEVDSLMSTWREDSDLAQVNRDAAAGPVSVAAATATVLDGALAMAAASGGAFDPTVLPLMRLWGLRDGPRRLPAAAEVDAVLSRTGYELVALDKAARVRFRQPGPALDFGGIAKGHALDAARAALAAAGVRRGAVDLGGSVLLLGRTAADSVDIASPDEGCGTVARVPAVDGVVATSGQYERFVEIDGRRYGHILDPRTGYPVERAGSVTVLGPDGMTADALATAMFVLGPDEGAALASRWPDVRWWFVGPDGNGGWTVIRSGGPGEPRSPGSRARPSAR